MGTVYSVCGPLHALATAKGCCGPSLPREARAHCYTGRWRYRKPLLHRIIRMRQQRGRSGGWQYGMGGGVLQHHVCVTTGSGPLRQTGEKGALLLLARQPRPLWRRRAAAREDGDRPS
eukprot:COSAG01_NODE_3349_length_6224_cov_19.144653_2_plen_118_part_00